MSESIDWQSNCERVQAHLQAVVAERDELRREIAMLRTKNERLRREREAREDTEFNRQVIDAEREERG